MLKKLLLYIVYWDVNAFSSHYLAQKIDSILVLFVLAYAYL